MSDFEHRALSLQEEMPLIYPAMSKHLFYYRMFISKFVYERGGVPLNPFMVSDYFLADLVDRDLIRQANNNIVKRSDEIWVFGAVSNGVLAEIKIANEMGKPVKFFRLDEAPRITQIDKSEVEMEDEVKDFKSELQIC